MKIKIFHDTQSHMIWAVRLVETGDKYGLKDALVNDKDTLVEFFDTWYEHTDLGQFVSRYYSETLLKRKSGGLTLDVEVNAWRINEPCMNRIRDWLRRQE